MRKFAILLLLALVALSGCAPAPPLAVTLESPANGSSVSSLTPILAWNCSETGASFRLQLASDGNFQNLIIDEANLGSPSYAVPSGKLTKDETYYWKVTASKAGKTSGWSVYWSFKTPAPTHPPPTTGTIAVNATLDGSSWSGSVNYNITGPKADSGSSVPQTFSILPTGFYTVSYSSGGPAGATLADITPSATQSLPTDATITFTLNFQTKPVSTIRVSATLDGSPWSGLVNYNIYGPKAGSSSSVPDSFSDVPAGTYSLSYSSGGPSGTTLASITPSPSQTVSDGSTVIFTLNFRTQASSTIRVKASLDDSSWSGNIRYTINGPYTDSGYSVPESFSNLPAGTYTISYSSGGPYGAMLTSITPSPTQTVSEGGNITFYLNFHRQATTGTISVQATLDGQPWQTAIGSGTISYSIHGPISDSSNTMPDAFIQCPAGSYTLSYNSGGPTGATLAYISPSPTQNLSAGGTITYTLVFHGQATGTVYVNATLNGAPWSGAIRYTLVGPYPDSHNSVPGSFTNCPPGSYSVSYTSGGPPAAVLENVTPSPTQNLSAGGTISFTLNFRGGATPY